MTKADADSFTFADAKREFEDAWQNPNHTRFELPALDVNAVLATRYVLEPARTMTLVELWDMEVKKAWDPASYIPYVVSAGRSWGRHPLEEGCERFFRASDQVSWICDEIGQVLEDVSISHKERKIFFLGRAEFPTANGERLRASTHQPLFHVEHAARGPEIAPENLWRIVVLTKAEDIRFKRPFEQMVEAGLLPGFIEEYIRRDMHVTLSRR
jgi:hypothetical protein